MSRLILYLGVWLESAAVSWLLTRGVRHLAQTWRVMDHPNRGRKRQAVAVPLLGGVAIYGGVVVSLLLLWGFGLLPDRHVSAQVLLGILLGCTLLMISGFLDDRYHLPPALQLVAPILAAIVAIAGGLHITVLTNPLGGTFQLPMAWSPGLTFGWLVVMMYATKLLDGVDGLVASVTAVGALVIFALSLSWDAPTAMTGVIALALAGSCCGFLPANRSPAKIFLGEGGSVMTGYLLGVLAIISGSKIATTLLVMAIPLLDVVWVVSERIRSRASPVQADRRHVHYRLLERGWQPWQVVAGLTGAATVFGLIGIVASPVAKIFGLALVVVSALTFLQWSRRPMVSPPGTRLHPPKQT